MPTPEQVGLETKLAAAASDRTQVPQFLSTLLDATVLVPGFLETQPDGRQTASFASLISNSGTSVQPFYTSEDRLQETIAVAPAFESRFVALRCRDLWQMLLGTELVLNPHSAHGKQFLPSEVGQLLSGSAGQIEIVIDHPTRIHVGGAAHIPAGMEHDLRSLFARFPSVESAYLGWKVTEETGDQSYLLVILGAPNIRSEVQNELQRALLFYSQSHPVDVSYPGPGEQNPLASIDPLYVKQTG